MEGETSVENGGSLPTDTWCCNKAEWIVEEWEEEERSGTAVAAVEDGD